MVYGPYNACLLKLFACRLVLVITYNGLIFCFFNDVLKTLHILTKDYCYVCKCILLYMCIYTISYVDVVFSFCAGCFLLKCFLSILLSCHGNPTIGYMARVKYSDFPG